MIMMSSKTAGAELRRYKRRQAALKGRLSRLIDAYAEMAAADIELKNNEDPAELRMLLRDLLSLVRDEFEPEDRIAGDGLLGSIFKEVSNEDEDNDYEISCLQ